MKTFTTERIEAELGHRFGAEAFRPRGDIDRPFTPAELRDFAREPFVHLGNHTANHAILTNYAPDQARRQIEAAQESLAEMTGVRPTSIAYPNGAFSRPIVEACDDLGLRVGFTVRPVKNALIGVGGIADGGLPANLRLGRFMLEGDSSFATQCRTYRSDFLLYSVLRGGLPAALPRPVVRHELSRTNSLGRTNE